MPILRPIAIALFLLPAQFPPSAVDVPKRVSPDWLAPYRDASARLMGEAVSSDFAWQRLAYLGDTYGNRLSGSPNLEAAIRWAVEEMKRDGLENVHPEAVKVPHWVRGEETAEILASPGGIGHRVAVTALGNSIGGSATAEVVEARSVAEIAALGAAVRGKIVFFNHTMSAPADYGKFVEMRSHGPSASGRAGAVAVLLRSLATASFRSPHTGLTIYDADAPRVPAAAVSTEDADLLHRLLQRGPVRVRIALGCRMLPDADSANVIGEVRGRDKPDEVVLIGAHLDSWDLAQGANDDGAGVAMVMEAGRLIASLQQRPRRTLRVVLFMNEENGLAGGKGYAAAHQAELGRHVAALEADSGADRPLSVRLRTGEGGNAMLAPWLLPLESLDIHLEEGDAGGADLTPMDGALVPLVSVHPDVTHYFDIHHSAADTLDKIDPENLAKNAAAIAVVAYALAEMPATLPRPAARPATH